MLLMRRGVKRSGVQARTARESGTVGGPSKGGVFCGASHELATGG